MSEYLDPPILAHKGKYFLAIQRTHSHNSIPVATHQTRPKMTPQIATIGLVTNHTPRKSMLIS